MHPIAPNVVMSAEIVNDFAICDLLFWRNELLFAFLDQFGIFEISDLRL